MPQREDGACIYLNDDNTCKVYKNRPEICNVRKMAERNSKALKISAIEYFMMVNRICNKWIKEDKMDDSYLIDIGKYGPDTTQS
jgi:Fe-S-cluster containining protein